LSAPWNTASTSHGDRFALFTPAMTFMGEGGAEPDNEQNG
jgi:hypothetical protein